MTPVQNRVIAVLSVISTIVVLVAGSSSSGLDAKVAAALAKQRTHEVAGGALAAGSDSSDDTGDEVQTFDGGAEKSAGGVVDVAAAEETPAEHESGGGTTPNADVEAKPTKIKHVFQITLAGHGFDAAFGPRSVAPYLSRQLVPKGALLTGYSSLGAGDLADHIAMVGGQPPNADTRTGCPVFKEFAQTVSPTATGEIATDGCVFPNTVATVADQLTASGRSWRGYVEDLDRGPDGVTACRRPASNAADDTLTARPGDGYATRHNPFVYFHSLLDLGDCDAQNGPLERLETDLRKVGTTPSYSYVVPNLCNDGTESPCVDGSTGGLPAADAFLAKWVPKILASPAYKQDGLLIVTFAGGPAAAPGAPAGEAGARNGTLLVSRFAEAGSTVGAAYDPYSVLRSVQDIFALRPIAKANEATSFADTVLVSAFVTPPRDD